MCDMIGKDLKHEVISSLIEVGYDAEYVITAVDAVYTPCISYARWFRLSLAWLREDWELLSSLYMAVCAQYLMESGYIITSISFTDQLERVGYFLVVCKDDLSYGSVVYGVRRTVHGLSIGDGLKPSELLVRL